jgi:hypothetical protein
MNAEDRGDHGNTENAGDQYKHTSKMTDPAVVTKTNSFPKTKRKLIIERPIKFRPGGKKEKAFFRKTRIKRLPTKDTKQYRTGLERSLFRQVPLTPQHQKWQY